jgi:hypothetical protein
MEINISDELKLLRKAMERFESFKKNRRKTELCSQHRIDKGGPKAD